MSRRRRAHPAAAGPVLLLGLLLAACTGPISRATPSSASATPTSAAGLGRLLVTQVPSGLPRLPDADLRPPAGEKSISDVASYAPDPGHQRRVLEEYGFRFGWERFWGRGEGPVTSVFVDQFQAPWGAARYSADLAGNDARHYHATQHRHAAGLPAGCRLGTTDAPEPAAGLAGPAAFAWCARGPFSVAVTAVSGSSGAAGREVAAVVRAQLARLPVG